MPLRADATNPKARTAHARIIAKDVIREAHLKSIKSAGDLRKTAKDARSEAGRWFGGFWMGVASAIPARALLGVLAAF